MTDTLDIVGHRLYRRAGTEVLSPGRPASPGTPTTVWACGFYPRAALAAAYEARGELIGGLPYVAGLDLTLLVPTGPDDVRAAYYDGGIIPGDGEWGFICSDFETAPGVPTGALEPVVAEAPAAGWNAGATSAQAFFKSGRVKFRVQAGERFIVGLGNNTDPLSLDGKFIGWKIDSGYAADLWRLGYGAEGSLVTGGGAMGTYVPADDATTYTVELLRGRMNFSRADGAGTSSSYALPVPLDAPDVWMLSAAVWAPGTWVEGIEVVAYSGADLVLPRLAGQAGVGSPYSGAVLTLPQLLFTEARNATRAALVLPMLKTRGGRPLAEAALVLPALRAVGQEELLLATAPRAALTLPTLTASAHATVGEVGRAALELPRMLARGTEGQIADAALVLPMLRVLSYAIPLDEGRMTSFADLDADSYAFKEVLVVMSASGALSAVIGVSIVKDGDVGASAVGAASFSLSAVLAEVITGEALTGVELPDDAGGEVWAVNLAETPASSTFENYAFNSFGTLGGQAYGVRDDGVYLLSGGDDVGQPIRASVSFGKQDFGTKTEKHLQRAYVGASSSGKMFLKVVAGDKEYIYAARSSAEITAQQRFDVGRGLKGNYFTFELFNSEGGDFEIDSVTFVAADFKRRI